MTTPARLPNFDALDAAVARWFQHVTDRGVFITDERFVVRRWNQWLAAQTGRSDTDVVGHQLQQAVGLVRVPSRSEALTERVEKAHVRDVLLRHHPLSISRQGRVASMIARLQDRRVAP